MKPRSGVAAAGAPAALTALTALAVVAAGAAAGCFRLAKPFAARTHVFGESFDAGPELVYVMYDPDGPRGPERPRHYAPEPTEHGEHARPPRLYRDATIELWAWDPSRDLSIRYYLKGDPALGGDFHEVKSLVGEVDGAFPNEVVFLEDVFPKRRNPFVFAVDDLSNPHGGLVLQNADLLLIRIEDRAGGGVQKLVFEYIESGFRFAYYGNILLSTGISFKLVRPPWMVRDRLRFADRFDTTDGAFSANFTMSFAFGWRSRATRGFGKWLGDNVMFVTSAGIGAFQGFDLTTFSINVALVQGFGFQLFDFFSAQILFKVSGTDAGEPPLSTAYLALGFDVTSFARFARRIGTRMFKDTSIESFEDH